MLDFSYELDNTNSDDNEHRCWYVNHQVPNRTKKQKQKIVTYVHAYAVSLF